MGRRWWIALGCALLACAATYVVGLRWIESIAVERLAQRGIAASVGTVQPRLLGVALINVEWTHRSGVARGQLAEVRVDVGWRGVRRVAVHGANVHLEGSLREVREAFRGKTVTEVGGNRAKHELPVHVEGLDVTWRGVFSAGRPAASEVVLKGITVGRSEGRVSLRIDQASARSRGLEGKAVLLVATVRSEDFGLQDLQVKSARGVVDLDAFGADLPEKTDAESTQGLVEPSLSANQRTSEAGRAPQGKLAAGTTPAEAQAGLLGWVPLKPGRGERLREMIQRLAGVVRRRLPTQGALEVGQVLLTVERGGQSLSIGPGRIYAEHTDGKLRVGFASGTVDEPKPFEISAEVPVETGRVEGRVRGGPLSLSALGIKAGDFGLQEVEQSTLTVDSRITLSGDGARADFSSSGALQAVALQHERLAPHALTGIDLGWDTEGHFHIDGSRVSVESGRVRFGEVEGSAQFELVREEKRLAVDAQLSIEAESCAEMWEALPAGAAPLLEGSEMSGQFSWRGGIKFDTDRLTEVDATWSMRNRCRFTAIPDEASPEQFRERFSLNVPGSDGELIDLTTGPGTRNWTPIQEMSPFLEVAVLTTEDAGFWNHRGFDSGAIESAIRRNVSSGKFTRGASTITMQLAKNLYLERDKYIARKVQEALLTMLLEQELRKHQILELYFNVIEYGPGVYGIRQAAKHYFNSVPGELSLAQCFFLASLLPNPKAKYFDEQGELSANRARLVRNLMKIAHKRNRISAEDLERGLREQLRFGLPHLESNPYRNPDGSTVDEPFYPGGGADLVDELP